MDYEQMNRSDIENEINQVYWSKYCRVTYNTLRLSVHVSRAVQALTAVMTLTFQK